MAATSGSVIFQSLFKIDAIEGKKFDKVSRIDSSAQDYNLRLRIDVNTEIYPMAAGERFTFCLAHSLSLDGGAAGGDRKEIWRDVGAPGKRTLADDFDYVMHGKVYKYTDTDEGSQITVLISFGGLLMALEGDGRPISGLELGQSVYSLIRKS